MKLVLFYVLVFGNRSDPHTSTLLTSIVGMAEKMTSMRTFVATPTRIPISRPKPRHAKKVAPIGIRSNSDETKIK